MSTSGTYLSGSPQVDQLITEAYERINITPNEFEGQKTFAAIRSMNLALNSWITRGLNLFTVKLGLLGLTPGQNAYALPSGTSRILEATIRTSTRNLGGSSFSSAGGIAANAFDGNPQTACTQSAPNGYISYNWNTSQYSIAMVGIQSNATLTYTLSFEYSLDNITWTSVLNVEAQTYTQGELIWFVVPIPTSGSLFRVRETGGSTLNVQELYFNTALNDTTITEISRYEWMTNPTKYQLGQPTSFWLNRQINPILTLWPVPTPQYNTLFYSRIQQIQDIGTLINTPDVPARFIDALSAETAFRLAVKNPDKVDANARRDLKAWADESFTLAAKEDTEHVPLRIYGDQQQGWGRV